MRLHLDMRLDSIGVDLTGILGEGAHDYKSPAVEAKKHIFLHCNASYLVLQILQHDKIWGDNPPLQILGGGFVPPSPRDLRPCSTEQGSDLTARDRKK